MLVFFREHDVKVEVSFIKNNNNKNKKLTVNESPCRRNECQRLYRLRIICAALYGRGAVRVSDMSIFLISSNIFNINSNIFNTNVGQHIFLV